MRWIILSPALRCTDTSFMKMRIQLDGGDVFIPMSGPWYFSCMLIVSKSKIPHRRPFETQMKVARLGFEPRSAGPKPTMMDHYTIGL